MALENFQIEQLLIHLDRIAVALEKLVDEQKTPRVVMNDCNDCEVIIDKKQTV